MRVTEVIIDVSPVLSRTKASPNLVTGLQVVRRAHGHLGMVCLHWGTGRLRSVANVDDRDESFNSITGLNGSGKSNILDSICFVLGITNMSTVRAQNLQVRITRPEHYSCPW